MTDIPWSTALAQRIRHLWWLKFIGTTAWVWVFFIGYFALLRHPSHAVTRMPLTPVDAWVPFQPGWLYPYLSLWLYVGIAPGLMPSFRSLVRYGLWTAGLCLAGLAAFYVAPTEVPAFDLRGSEVPGFSMLQGVDASGNACPSMHVAFAVFSGIWVQQILARVRAPLALKLLNVAWCLAIAWSTMAIRQHVFLDVLVGAALGSGFAWASLPRGSALGGRVPGPAMIDRIPEKIAP